MKNILPVPELIIEMVEGHC